MRACGIPARKVRPTSIPAKRTSTPYTAPPVTFATVSTRGTDVPTTLVS
jgi:hypothetical protein